MIHRKEIPLPQAIQEYNTTHISGADNWYKAQSKLHIYGLTYFDKIVYLDCDTCIYQNIDDLFDRPHMSGVKDLLGTKIAETSQGYLAIGDEYFNYPNAGVLVIEPSQELFDNFLKFTCEIAPNRVLQDQNLLALYYPNWLYKEELHLPVYYNVLYQAMNEYLTYDWFEPSEIKVIHFVAKKPWQKTKEELTVQEENYLTILKEIVESIELKGFTSKNLYKEKAE